MKTEIDEYIFCPMCDYKCLKAVYDVFGCASCDRKMYDEMKRNTMDIPNDLD